MKLEEVRDILSGIRKMKAVVYGDFCLDVYWVLDQRGSEISVETGLKAVAVGSHSYSLGGAGNVVSNMAALEPERISAVGVVGADPFGREILRQLQALNVDTSGMIVQAEDFVTMAYCKRIMDHEEKARLDFGMFNRRTAETDKALLASLGMAFKTADVIMLNQQVEGSITNGKFIEAVNHLAAGHPERTVILDSRHHGANFRNVSRKMNQRELAALNDVDLPRNAMLSLHDLKGFAARVKEQSGKTVFVTRGSRGIYACDAGGDCEVPGIQVAGSIDPVGAGDTVLSAVACCLAAGVSTGMAAEFAGLAAGVTVQKIHQTGTASGSEILAMLREADYVYQPELADDHALARRVGNSEIELCCEETAIPRGRIQHAVFDNDGTLSVLRSGWDTIMERMMVKIILGENRAGVSDSLRDKVRNAVHDYIEHSAGEQTIVRMETLVGMIKSFRLVPRESILGKIAYRDLYHAAITELVDRRLQKMKRGELGPEDFMIKGARSFLETLRKKGVTLYLASGANSRDVTAEARVLGYADLFNGGIYGSSSEIRMHPNKIIIGNIIRANRLAETEVACFGDGPGELRECRRRGGFAVGLATDESIRYGLNLQKRKRLIRAGAQIIVPDFSQSKELVDLLFP